MTWFDGWSRDKNAEKMQQENKRIYSKTNYRAIRSMTKLESDNYVYFEGNLSNASKLSEKQLFMYATEGCGKFGGYCTRVVTHFYGQYYKDNDQLLMD